jgi:hypothetical protein
VLGQGREKFVDATCDPFGHELVVDPLRPGNRRHGPCARRVEPLANDPIGTPGALFSTGGGAGPVEKDAEEPGLERGPALEPLDAPDDREPGVLAHLFGDGPAADGGLGEAKQPRLVHADELDERGLVAGTQPLDEPDVILHADRGYDGAGAGDSAVVR